MPDYAIPQGVSFCGSPHIVKRFRGGHFYAYNYVGASPTVAYRIANNAGTVTATSAESGATAGGPNRYNFVFPDGLRGTFIETTITLVGATDASATVTETEYVVDPIRTGR